MQKTDLSLTLRALGRLLDYPDEALLRARGDLAELLSATAAMDGATRGDLCQLMGVLGEGDLLDAQALYVETFDRGRQASLHLFEHVHGDSRERGQAMVDLRQSYARGGWHMAEGELPDYLPAVLEFASTQPEELARAFVGEIVHILQPLHAALARMQSPYACVLAALLEVMGEAPLLPEPQGDAPAQEDMDAAWVEPAAFGRCANTGQGGAAQPVHFIRKTSSQPSAAAGAHS